MCIVVIVTKIVQVIVDTAAITILDTSKSI